MNECDGQPTKEASENNTIWTMEPQKSWDGEPASKWLMAMRTKFTENDLPYMRRMRYVFVNYEDEEAGYPEILRCRAIREE